MNKFWVITKEVYKKNVKSVGFIVMLLAPLLAIGIFYGISYFIAQDEQNAELDTVAIISENPAMQEMFTMENAPYEIQTDITTQEAAEEALLNEELDGYLTVNESGSTIDSEIVHTDSLTNIIPILNEQLSNYQTMLRASELNLSQEQVVSLSEPVVIEESIVSVEDGNLTQEENNDTTVKEFGAYIVSFAVYFFILFYASVIAGEVASEKGTRIMEIILSSASATSHFFGKLAGVLLILLTQVVAYVLIGLVTYYFVKDSDVIQGITQGIDLAEIARELLGYTSIFFITGVLMYVVFAAFFGSLVTKIEDVNKSITPVVTLSIIGLYVGIFAFASPENIVPVVFSYIPLFTPFVMPYRIASETVGQLGIWISIIGTVGFTAILTYISFIFYRANVLIYSDGGIVKSIKRSWGILKSNRKAKKTNA